MIVAILAFFASCNSPSNKNTVEASEEQEVSEVEDAVAYELDTAQSIITWIGSKPTGQHNGTISLSSGTFQVSSEQDLAGGNFEIDIKDLEVKDLEKGSDNYKKLKSHLMSEDFFAAGEYPTASFEITAIEPFDSTSVDDKDEFKTKYTPAKASEFMVADPTHNVSGNLTMRGETKNITFPAQVTISGDQLTAKAKFNIDRTDWKLSYGDEASAVDKTKDKFIYNTVNVGLEVMAKKSAMKKEEM